MQKISMAWSDLTDGNRCLFRGVAEGWWDGVDTNGDQNRWRPIPFPLIYNINGAGTKKMSHVLCELGLFGSVGEANRAGWNKPAKTGEYYFFGRTRRVLIIWVKGKSGQVKR